MQVTREELIYTHKRIWNSLYRVIKKLGKITPSDVQFYKDGLLCDIYNENIVSNEALNYVYCVAYIHQTFVITVHYKIAQRLNHFINKF